MLRWLKFSLVALVGCGFLGMIVYAMWMRDEIRSAQMEPPLISAPELPVKRRPEEPGGMEIPNRDKLVFDLLDGTGGDVVTAPAPVDAAEDEPHAPLTPTMRVASSVSSSEARKEQGMETQNSPVNPVADQLALAKLAAQIHEDDENAKHVQVAVVSASNVKTDSKPVSVTASVSKTATTDTAPIQKGGSWGVQVVAVNTENDAATLATTLKGKYPALKGLVAHTSKVSSGASVRYRVQFVGVKDRVSAAKVCTQLGDKQPCFPISL